MSIEVRPYGRGDLEGVLMLCEAEAWPSFPADPDRAHRALTAAGVTSVVAHADGEVVGFAQLQSDGEIQAHLSLIATAAAHRGQGIARRMLALALARAGGERIDLITDSAERFYAGLKYNRRLVGFRLWPPFEEP
ncbi:MAG: GNAT family N-acetyltransferase [Alphaproteobacteria bacterium]|nr:GNAT family N-acetyltransferase [Alphaproteobacteria bacterium]